MDQESRLKIYYLRAKNWVAENESMLILTAGFLLIAIISFGLGKLWEQQISAEGLKAPIVINKSKSARDSTLSIQKVEPQNIVANILYVASKNGTSYHLLNCPGAKQIKPENKIEFNSKEEAESRGYKPAKNCPGLFP